MDIKCSENTFINLMKDFGTPEQRIKAEQLEKEKGIFFWTQNRLDDNAERKIEEAVEGTFPEEHYGGLHYFEGWSLREIVKQAMRTGYFLNSHENR